MLRSHVHPTAVHEQDDQARTADPSGRADDHPGATAPPQHGATAPQQHGATAPQQHTSPESSPDASGALVQLLAPDGTRTSDPEYEAWVEDVDAARLVDLYEDLVVVRRLDVEATALQRQGQLGLWPPLLGQEAAQVGSARVLRTDDFVFSSYRENAVAYCRGVDLTDMVKVWRGTANSGWDPFAVGMATPQIIIGAQTLHATGWAIGAVKDGTDAAAVAYFGDGATSQGDVNEAMVFAASFRAPVVFFCQNNQWAISEPVGLQAVRPIADRAPGFGIPSVRVDGNDVLAVMAVTRRALDRARRGDGPTFVEAVTYRMGPHTTSDDPTRYVDPADREVWAQRDPLLRVERLLEREGLLDDQVSTRVKHAADAAARGMRAGCLGLTAPEPLSVFDHVYATPSTWLERQRSQYAAYLAMYADDDPAPAATAPATGTGVPGVGGAR
jgi:pyruvate dehydrogenase E1 component alpha subunit